MPPFPWIDLVVILALVAVNGFFALSELALVSSRRARLQALDKQGRWGAATALALAADPGRFLSSVQIGITLVGILAGAYSGASLGDPIGARLVPLGVPADLADDAGFGVAIALTTYLSLTIGELIPKQLALRAPERIACVVSPALTVVAKVGAPLVWLLDTSTSLVLRLLGSSRENDQTVTTEEIKLVVAEAESHGSIERSEQRMISGVIRLASRPVRGVMTPRTAVEWLDVGASEADTRARLMATKHTRLPLAEGSVDRIVGVVQARDALAALIEGRALALRDLARVAPVIPDVADATDALSALRDADVPMLLVHDEYGHFEGVVTPADLLAAISGDFRSDVEDGHDPPAVDRGDGSWLFSGALPADEMAERLEIELPDDRDYQTVAGYLLATLKHLPVTGERVGVGGWQFEVVDMDGFKIDKVLATPIERRA